MDSETSRIIAHLAAAAAVSHHLPEARDAATLTGALPVRCDFGGILLLRADGELLHYDSDDRTVTPVTDPLWRINGMVAAARMYRPLQHLMPARPVDGQDCPQCHGAGRMYELADCGVCGGTGWTVPANNEPGPRVVNGILVAVLAAFAAAQVLSLADFYADSGASRLGVEGMGVRYESQRSFLLIGLSELAVSTSGLLMGRLIAGQETAIVARAMLIAILVASIVLTFPAH